MLLEFNGNTPHVKHIQIGVSGNNDVDDLVFVIKRKQGANDLFDFTPKIKISTSDGDFAEYSGEDLEVLKSEETDVIRIIYTFPELVTKQGNVDIQLVFEKPLSNGKTKIWQTVKINATFPKGIDESDSVLKAYPNIIRELQENTKSAVDALNREVEKIENAVETANTAKEVAESVSATASSAVETANTAKEVAESISATALSAVENSINAMNTANDAANAAQNSANSAQNSENSAASAVSAASAASDFASSAVETANTAKEVAESASATALSAIETANTAKEVAESISETASSAVVNSINAMDTANAANDAANAAQNSANSAQNSANAAQNSANSAQDTANNAVTAANSAQDTANNAVEIVNGAFDLANQAQIAIDEHKAAYDSKMLELDAINEENAKKIAANLVLINEILGTTDENNADLTSIKDLVLWIEEHGVEVAEIIRNIETLQKNKVNVSDIVDNLITNVANKPLSAKHGAELKKLIDNLDTAKIGKIKNNDRLLKIYSEKSNNGGTTLTQAKSGYSSTESYSSIPIRNPYNSSAHPGTFEISHPELDPTKSAYSPKHPMTVKTAEDRYVKLTDQTSHRVAYVNDRGTESTVVIINDVKQDSANMNSYTVACRNKYGGMTIANPREDYDAVNKKTLDAFVVKELEATATYIATIQNLFNPVRCHYAENDFFAYEYSEILSLKDKATSRYLSMLSLDVVEDNEYSRTLKITNNSENLYLYVETDLSCVYYDSAHYDHSASASEFVQIPPKSTYEKTLNIGSGNNSHDWCADIVYIKFSLY